MSASRSAGAAPPTSSSRPIPAARKAPRVRALDGLCVEVPAGTVFALLGPNGAGKSTTVKILTTLSRPDSGQRAASPASTSLATPDAVRRAIGLVSQKPSSDPMATGRENLVLAGRIQGLSRAEARARAPRAARPVRPRRRRRPAGQDLVGRHVPQARRRDRARAPAAGALPRRADHRPRPAGPRRDVGRDRTPVRRRAGHRAAHHALPRRGRPPRRPAGDRRPRPRRRRGHARRAQERAARRHRPRRARLRRGRRPRGRRPAAGWACATSSPRATGCGPGRTTVRAPSPPCSRRSTRPERRRPR